MKKILLLMLPIMIGFSTSAQQGKVFDNLTMNSEILKTAKRYAIYLPPDYGTSKRSYSVLYLLHGGGGNQTVWIQNGDVQNTADKMINEGRILPLIIVMPDASSPVRGYTNDPRGDWLFEDFFIKEFIPFIEQTYRINSGKSNRFIAGLSGGAHGTFNFAFHHPEMFEAACPLSAATWPGRKELKEKLETNYPGITEEQISEFVKKYDILEQINNYPETQKDAIRWYISCGDDDLLAYEVNSEIHIAMTKKSIPHEYRIKDGEHKWEFWRSELPYVLEFCSGSLSN
jgi:enterochelin esterase-like enzyme